MYEVITVLGRQPFFKDRFTRGISLLRVSTHHLEEVFQFTKHGGIGGSMHEVMKKMCQELMFTCIFACGVTLLRVSTHRLIQLVQYA